MSVDPAKSTSRRRFLRQTLLGSAFLTIVKPFRLFGFAGLPSSPPLQFFSAYEFQIMKAVAARIIGIDGRSGLSAEQVAIRADAYFGFSDPEVQDQIHQLFTVFNAPFFTFLFDWRFSSFVTMSPEDQDTYLEDWMTSSFAFRRTGFQALKRVSLSMYYTDERSWKEIGYEGMFLPGER